MLMITWINMSTVSFNINAGWTPDLPKADIAKSNGLVTAKNILPVGGSYLPVLNKAAYNSTAASGTPISGITMQNSDGTYYNFLGTSTKLYRFDNTNMTDVTRAAGAYTATSWSFAKYGTWIVATDFADDVQVLKDLGSGTNFVALGGSPPKAKYCLVNSGHLILAYIDDGTAYPKKIIWSAREDIEDYSASLVTGSDSQEFPDMDGVITGIGALGDAFVLAAQNSLTIGYYAGGTYTYNFQINAVQNIGCFFPGSFVSIGSEVFFWGKDSIYRFNGEAPPIDIGNKIKKTLFSLINLSYSQKITVACDKVNSLILWAFPSTGSTNPDTILIYNYLEDRFTYISMDLYCLFIGATGGLLLDSLTSSIIDEVSILLDSNYWTANDLQPILFCTDDSKAKTFSGPSLTAEIETGEFEDIPKMNRINKAYIPIEGESATGSVIIKHRYSKTDAQTSSSSSSIKSDSSVDLRTTNRYLSLNLQASSFIKLGNTITVDIAQTGSR